MNNTMAMRVTRELPRILIFGLSGFFVGFLMDGAGQSADHGEPMAEVCRDAAAGKTGITEGIATGGETKVSRPAIDQNGLRAAAPTVSEEIAVSVEGQDLEERIRDTLLADEAAAGQQNEQPHSDDADSDLMERIRTIATEKRLEYIKDIANNRDDASITELTDLILFEDEGVRHAALDTLIEILGQETGHYDAIEAALAENSVFMDDGQISKVSEIARTVETRRLRMSAETD